MTSAVANQDSFAPSRLLIRALDCSQRGDYVAAFAVGARPTLLAWLIGAHRTVGEHVGYWNGHWWTQAIIFPALVWVFRLLMSRVVPVGPPWPPPRNPPIVELARGEEARFFQVNPKDVDRCFGFRAAHVAFNTQVRALMIAGVAIFVSRYGVLITSASGQPEFLSIPPRAPDFGELFPLPSQWIMALAWLVALAVVAMPTLVKLLPWLGPERDRGERSVGDFLREYFSAQTWPKDRKGGDATLSQVAAGSARNSFWPTGDNRAGVLFFFAYWIFLLTLVPVPLNNLALVLLIVAGSAALAHAGRPPSTPCWY